MNLDVWFVVYWFDWSSGVIIKYELRNIYWLLRSFKMQNVWIYISEKINAAFSSSLSLHDKCRHLYFKKKNYDYGHDLLYNYEIMISNIQIQILGSSNTKTKNLWTFKELLYFIQYRILLPASLLWIFTV